MPVLLALLLSSAAPAREGARAEFTRGEALYAKGQYAPARDAFTASYAALPLGATAWNLGRCAQALGQPREAIGWYRRYLRMEPAAPDRDATLAAVRAQEQTLARHKVQALTVFAQPAHAALFVDEFPVGVDGATVELTAGPHQVRAHAEGHVDARLEVEVTLAASQAVSLVLTAVPDTAAPPPPSRRPVVSAAVEPVEPVEPSMPEPTRRPTAPPEGAPTLPATDGAGRPTSVYVHLESDARSMRLYRLLGTTTTQQTVYVNGKYQTNTVSVPQSGDECLQPCNKHVLAPTDQFYLAATGSVPSAYFSLHDYPRGVTLRAKAGSVAGNLGGVLLMSFGGVGGSLATIGGLAGLGRPDQAFAAPLALAGVVLLVGSVWGGLALMQSSVTEVWAEPTEGGRFRIPR